MGIVFLLEDDVPPNSATLPAAGGKTSTTDESQVDLATTVDGGTGVICIDSIPSQRIHVIPPRSRSITCVRNSCESSSLPCSNSG